MDIFCCCGHLRPKKKTQHGEDPVLPTLPPQARLPPLVPYSLALSPESTIARSSLTNPLPGAAADASVQLGELIVEDSDEENGDHDEDPAQDSKNRSTSTLQAVKSCIRRHLSQDSLSRESETEEQIARRAEVKRLLRKRIQEELRSEADVVSSEPFTPPRLAYAHVNVAANGPRDTIEFTVAQGYPDTELATSTACHLEDFRDDHRRRLSGPLSEKSSATSIGKENQRPESRAASLDTRVESGPIASQDYGVQERTSLLGIPKSPVLLPVKGPISHDASSLKSWRLSLSADKLDDLSKPVETLSLCQPATTSPAGCFASGFREFEPFEHQRSKSSPLTVRNTNTATKSHSGQASLDSTIRDRIPASESLVREESPVGLWLRTQSMQFHPSTTSRPPSEHESAYHIAYRMTKSKNEAQGALTATSTDTIRACPQSDLGGSPRRSGIATKSGRYSFATSVLNVPQEARTASSSTQPSATVPAADSPARPKYDVKPLQSPHRKGFGGLRLPSFKWSHPPNKSQNSLRLKPPGSSRPNSATTSLSLSNARRTTMEVGSETSSFLRREAELRAVEERFRDSHLRMEPLVPVESKFKEIFDHDGDPLSSNRNSLLFRLYLNVPKRDKPVAVKSLDGSGSDHISPGQEPSSKPASQPHWTSSLDKFDHGHLKVPVAIYGPSREKSSGTSLRSSRKSDESGRHRGFSSSKEGDETVQMWKRALRAESESRSPRGSMSSNAPISPTPTRAIREFKEVPTTPQPSGNESLSESPPGVHSPTCEKRSSRRNEANFQETLMRSNIILRDWAHQLYNQEEEAEERYRHDASTPSHEFQASKIPPKSWARFPSHNRDQRNASAGEADMVKPKDFAVKGVSAAGHVNWASGRMHDGSPLHQGIGRSFSDKFTQSIKARLGKLIPGRSGTPSRDKSMQGGRRSSIQTGGDLEYPELELLPTAGRYKELRALERGIDEIKGVKRRLSSDNVSTQHDRSSLTEKMASALQQHDGGSDVRLPKTSGSASFVEGKASMVRIRSPDTPATQVQYPDAVHAKDASGSTVERYATPFSHLTPSECGQSQAATPELELETGYMLPLTTNSPSSVKSVASVIGRASLHLTPDLVLPCDQTGTRNRRDKLQRRSAPMPVAPVLV